MTEKKKKQNLRIYQLKYTELKYRGARDSMKVNKMHKSHKANPGWIPDIEYSPQALLIGVTQTKTHLPKTET